MFCRILDSGRTLRTSFAWREQCAPHGFYRSVFRAVCKTFHINWLAVSWPAIEAPLEDVVLDHYSGDTMAGFGAELAELKADLSFSHA